MRGFAKKYGLLYWGTKYKKLFVSGGYNENTKHIGAPFYFTERKFKHTKGENKNEKCDYCGNECDESFFRTLDNGSEACFNCAKDEEKRNESRSEINKEKEKENEK